MIAGHPESFGIEAELLEIHGKWTYGRLRFWVGGVEVGDFDNTSDLATSARWGRTFLAASSSRTRPDLDRMSPEDVYQLLYGRFIREVRRVGAAPAASPAEIWDRDPYLLDDVGESAVRDHVAILVVRRGDDQDRIIVRSFARRETSEVVLPAGACDATIETYCAWAEGLSASSDATRT